MAMDVLNHREITAEGERHMWALAAMARIIKDPQTIKAQIDTVKSNQALKNRRVAHLNHMLEQPCADCKHDRSEHLSGAGGCLHALKSDPCECTEWVVVDES